MFSSKLLLLIARPDTYAGLVTGWTPLFTTPPPTASGARPQDYATRRLSVQPRPFARGHTSDVSTSFAILVVLIALIASELAPAAAMPERAETAPALRLVRVQPLTLVGKGFKPREHVRVTVAREDRTVTRALEASEVGGFMVSFAELKLRRCAALFVRASGARSSRAILRFAPTDVCDRLKRVRLPRSGPVGHQLPEIV